MLKRIYNKAFSIFDTAIGQLHLFLEQKNKIATIPYSVYAKKENQVYVNHKYPVNFEPQDRPLFDHCTNYDTHQQTVYQLQSVNVSERGIIFKKFNNCWLSFPHVVFRADYGWRYILKQYLFNKRVVLPANKTYILFYDFWSSANYYHWLVDAMPRLLSVTDLLAQESYSLLLPQNCPKYILQSLSYFNIKNITYIKIGQFLQAENLLLPYYLAGSGHIHPTKVFEVKQYFIANKSIQTNSERIYVSRSRQKARRVINENEVIDVVKSLGFKVVYFEDYSFNEQVLIGLNTKIMISSHGANLTNLMFMPEKSKVLELIRFDKPNFCYWALSYTVNVDYYYQLCKVIGNDHLFVDIERFKLNLQLILND
jgi:hypothetical protein